MTHSAVTSAAEISQALRDAGYRVRTSAPRSEDAVRVRPDGPPGRFRVSADYEKTIYACILAGELATKLSTAGFEVDSVDEARTFFYVLGRGSTS